MIDKIISDMIEESHKLKENNFQTNNSLINQQFIKGYKYYSFYDLIDHLRLEILKDPEIKLNDLKKIELYNMIRDTINDQDIHFFRLNDAGFYYSESKNKKRDLAYFKKEYSLKDIYDSTDFKFKEGENLIIDNLLKDKKYGYVSFINGNRKIFYSGNDNLLKHSLGSSQDLYITSDVENQMFFLSNGIKVNNHVYSNKSIILDVNSIESIRHTCLLVENHGLKLTDIINSLNK